MKYRLVTLAIFGLGIMLVLSFSVALSSTVTGELVGTIICLDPGHGGSDPGAVNSEYGLRESDINLDVSFGLKKLLEGEALFCGYETARYNCLAQHAYLSPHNRL